MEVEHFPNNNLSRQPSVQATVPVGRSMSLKPNRIMIPICLCHQNYKI